MLVLAGEIHDLGNLGLGHFVCKHTADRDALLVDLEHDAGRILDAHREELLEDEHDEFHRRVIVVEHQNFVIGWLLGAWPGPRGDAGLHVAGIVAVAVRVAHHGQARHHSS